MKRNFLQIFGLFTFLFLAGSLGAQSLTKNTATVSNCGCPGELWSFTTPYQPWVFFPSVTNSKRLMHTSYDFNIPVSATITGVKVDFDYTTTNAPANTLKDTLCTLLVNGVMAGTDQSPTTPYYGTSGHITFGGPGELWGLGLTPADVNTAGFGFNFKMYAGAGGSQMSFTNGAPMTVYYNTASGISESQKSSPGLKVFYTHKQLKIDTEVPEKTEAEIFDLTGKKIFRSTLEGASRHTVDLSSLEKGVYLYSVKTSSKSKVAKFIQE